MKKMSVCVVLVTTAVLAATAEDTKQDRAARKRARRAEMQKAGVVEKQQTGKVFRVLDVSGALSADKVDNLTRSIRHMSLIPVEIVHGEKLMGSAMEAAEKLISHDNVGAGVVIVEDPKMPILLVSPDRYWTILNIAPLKADSPSDDLFLKRFAKVYWGAIARALGAGISSYAGCVLSHFKDVKQLDQIVATAPCPEPFNKMIDGGKAVGINAITLASYKQACIQGWAPQPTNDVQKAIWDEIHKLPTEPIKIQPETKPVKE